MTPSTEKLLGISSEALSKERPTALSLTSHADSLSQDLLDMLSRKNGFLAFESALHVFPSATSASCITLAKWNETTLWKETYKHLAVNHFFFAEDVFGNQFSFMNDGIFRFDAETGEAESFSPTLEDWSTRMLKEYDVETGYPLAHQWQLIYGRLNLDFRLIPKMPFVLGGKYALGNLVSKAAVLGMRLRGDLAIQLHDLPDGTQIQFKVTD